MSIVTGSIKSKEDMIKDLRSFILKGLNGKKVSMRQAENLIGDALVCLEHIK